MKNAIQYIRTHFWQIVRYGIVSVTSLLVTLGLNYLFIHILGLATRLGYLLSTTLGYTYMYFSSTIFTFRQKVNYENSRYFLVYIAVFWSLNNLFFNVIYSLTHWHYQLITLLNIAIFFPVRFYSQKYLVFKDHKQTPTQTQTHE